MVKTLGLSLAMVGNLNCILYTKDKKGGKPFYVNWEVQEFHTFFHPSNLIDMDYQGSKFTWSNNRLDLGLARVWKRKDWAFVSDSWLSLFFESKVQHLTRFASDHRPLLLIALDVWRRGWIPFRFEKL